MGLIPEVTEHRRFVMRWLVDPTKAVRTVPGRSRAAWMRGWDGHMAGLRRELNPEQRYVFDDSGKRPNPDRQLWDDGWSAGADAWRAFMRSEPLSEHLMGKTVRLWRFSAPYVVERLAAGGRAVGLRSPGGWYVWAQAASVLSGAVSWE